MGGTSTTGYKLLPASTPVINWTDLWHIVVVSVAAGAGLAIAFGLILLAWEYISEGRSEGIKLGGGVLGLVATAACVLAIVAGVYAMTHPAKSKPQKVEKTSLVAPVRLGV
jgi:hypothetical protein